MGVKIVSTGSYLPEKVLTNAELEKMVETSDEWIRTRTGISERRIAAPEEAVSDLGTRACRLALERAKFPAEKLDALITATITGDYHFPSTACIIQEQLGARNAFAFDLSAACSGFLYGLACGRGLILSGQCQSVLLVAAETMSRVTDYTDRGTCILLGDGAGAVLLTADDKDAVLGSYLASNGSFVNLLLMPGGGSRLPASHETVDKRLHFMKMEGQALFKVAVQSMVDAARKALERANVSPDDISLVIPHQANLRIIQSVVKNLSMPMEKVFLNIQNYGNMSAASIAVGLDEAITGSRVKKGDLVLLFTFGAGLTWGAAVIRL